MGGNEDDTQQSLHFFYDAQSRPAFAEYNGVKYRYIHNLQGDIVGIVDGNGTLVVEYRYDAWGKPLSIAGTLKTSLGELNPFRYRRYVWDEETALHYLRSRYYNSWMCRFANDDVLLWDTLTGKNGYSYCANTPVISHDADGCAYNMAILNNLLHRKVQEDIVEQYFPGRGVTEQLITDLPKVGWRITTNGKLDVYDSSTRCFWEVKKASISANLGMRQVDRYAGGIVDGAHPIPGGRLEGRIVLEYGDTTFGILYYSIAPGLVVYEVIDLSVMQPVPIPSERALSNMVANRNAGEVYQKSGKTAPAFFDSVKIAGTVIFAVVIFAGALISTGDPGFSTAAAGQVLAY